MPLHTISIKHSILHLLSFDSITLLFNKALKSLDLSDNNLTDFLGKMEGIAAIAAALSRNQLLKSLNLSCNVIGAQGAAIMSDCIVSNASLTSIDLSDNHFGSEGCKSIASILSRGSFTAIRTLDLSHNSLCGKYGNTDESAVIALAGAVRGHETLTDLNLVDNQVTVAAGRIQQGLALVTGSSQHVRDFLFQYRLLPTPEPARASTPSSDQGFRRRARGASGDGAVRLAAWRLLGRQALLMTRNRRSEPQLTLPRGIGHPPS